MKNLLWREFHWNRVVVIETAVVFLLPYAFTLLLMLWPKESPLSSRKIAESFAYTALVSLVISQITIAFLAGNAFAGERSDNTAEFVGYLPVSRGQRLASKLLFALVIAVLIWGINLLVFLSLAGPELPGFGNARQYVAFVRYLACVGLAVFGAAWCLSSILTSPSLSASAGILTPILIGLSFHFAAFAMGISSEGQRQLENTWFPVATITVGIVGLALGIRLFLKRVEP